MPAGRERIDRALTKNAIFRSHPIFGELASEFLDRLTSHAVRRTVKRGATIFTKGDPGGALFVVCSGTVKISALSPHGGTAAFNLISDGGIFGEVALLDGRPRTADAMAVTDCELIVIERRDFLNSLQQRSEISLKLIEVLCSRLRHTTEQLEDIMFYDLPSRLAKTLLRLAENAKPSPNGPKIPLTQRDLSEMIGISRESTNKQLRIWEKRNWILLQRGGIVILASDAIAAVAATPTQD